MSGSDVYAGCEAVRSLDVSSIGDGVVMGAGAVVTKDVPPYALVVGNPARIVKYRFSPEKVAELSQSQWWSHTIDELKPDIEGFLRPVE